MSGQPGVVCLTPMAWLLATWGGLRYVTPAEGRAARHPLLAAAVVGALIGIGEGIFFIAVVDRAMPPATADDAAKTLVLDAVIVAAGICICAGLSVLTALITLKRLERERAG